MLACILTLHVNMQMLALSSKGLTEVPTWLQTLQNRPLMDLEEISHPTVILNPTNVYTEQESQEILCQCLSFIFLEIFHFVFNCPTPQWLVRRFSELTGVSSKYPAQCDTSPLSVCDSHSLSWKQAACKTWLWHSLLRFNTQTLVFNKAPCYWPHYAVVA